MHTARLAASVAILGALAAPVVSATSATAAPSHASVSPSPGGDCDRRGPWTVLTKAVTIRSRATSKSTARGVLYKGHKFTVHKTRGNWHYITDKSTGVKGWVSGSYVYREVYMCLH
ncbi:MULTISPECIES: SH3 domain-containing protein [unclassified Streptomyces]|uniref:SH3 domain-containing protein n=1 Tax=unclassified Streptomyces TaxID=2593676 RepID=UPI002E19E582|nr:MULTISPECIES: SH3 domain-containing protein [unclassified Streptomyces]